MNCIKALKQQLQEREPYRLNSLILEFHELPAEQKMDFDYYDKGKHFIFYCKKCEM